MGAKKITAEKFIEAAGYPPEDDDLERCNCVQAGQIGHMSCGWCDRHDVPVFMCGCIRLKDGPKHFSHGMVSMVGCIKCGEGT